MYIDVDYNPSPKETFFISVGMSDTEAISFDYTIKGQRITKQNLIAHKKHIDNAIHDKPTSEWDVIELKDGKFLTKRHVKWVDKGRIDEVGGEVWETEWYKDMDDSTKQNLLNFSQYISDNYKNLDSQKMNEFEIYIKKIIKKFSLA